MQSSQVPGLVTHFNPDINGATCLAQGTPTYQQDRAGIGHAKAFPQSQKNIVFQKLMEALRSACPNTKDNQKRGTTVSLVNVSHDKANNKVTIDHCGLGDSAAFILILDAEDKAVSCKRIPEELHDFHNIAEVSRIRKQGGLIIHDYLWHLHSENAQSARLERLNMSRALGDFMFHHSGLSTEESVILNYTLDIPPDGRALVLNMSDGIGKPWTIKETKTETQRKHEEINLHLWIGKHHPQLQTLGLTPDTIYGHVFPYIKEDFFFRPDPMQEAKEILLWFNKQSDKNPKALAENLIEFSYAHQGIPEKKDSDDNLSVAILAEDGFSIIADGHGKNSEELAQLVMDTALHSFPQLAEKYPKDAENVLSTLVSHTYLTDTFSHAPQPHKPLAEIQPTAAVTTPSFFPSAKPQPKASDISMLGKYAAIAIFAATGKATNPDNWQKIDKGQPCLLSPTFKSNQEAAEVMARLKQLLSSSQSIIKMHHLQVAIETKTLQQLQIQLDRPNTQHFLWNARQVEALQNAKEEIENTEQHTHRSSR